MRDESSKNADKLRNTFEQWTNGARKIGRVPRSKARSATRTMSDRQRTGAIREWAKNNGYDVSSCGRIQADIVEAYNKAS
ncbi:MULTISPECIES: Lsr2 family protein [Corynebacteriales]|uniref:histone-like nucleoid-structuring protein Lsr2 n=1 Tax=Nocardia TaxID=1817 RepID=UPI0009EDEC5C|nr:Lsr2 family protein [Nocardia nova]